MLKIIHALALLASLTHTDATAKPTNLNLHLFAKRSELAR